MVEEFAFDNTEERRKQAENGIGWVEVIVGSCSRERAKSDQAFEPCKASHARRSRFSSLPLTHAIRKKRSHRIRAAKSVKAG